MTKSDEITKLLKALEDVDGLRASDDFKIQVFDHLSINVSDGRGSKAANLAHQAFSKAFEGGLKEYRKLLRQEVAGLLRAKAEEIEKDAEKEAKPKEESSRLVIRSYDGSTLGDEP